MLSLRNYLIIGCVGFALTIVSIYLFLYQEQSVQPLDDATVEECRNLARQSMQLSVEAAQTNVDLNDPNDRFQIDDFQRRANSLQSQLDELRCGENADKWVYGSFKQEMIEHERYIADLIRENKNN